MATTLRFFIIPLLTMQEDLGWSGRYQYVVMAITTRGLLGTVAARELLQLALVCTPEEMEKGRALLEAFIRDVAGSIKVHDVKESFADADLTTRALAAWAVHTLVRTKWIKWRKFFCHCRCCRRWQRKMLVLCPWPRRRCPRSRAFLTPFSLQSRRR